MREIYAEIDRATRHSRIYTASKVVEILPYLASLFVGGPFLTSRSAMMGRVGDFLYGVAATAGSYPRIASILLFGGLLVGGLCRLGRRRLGPPQLD